MPDPFCFVIMGFGKKTNYSAEPPRTLDLDKTYLNIISPAVKASGLHCVRSDEVQQSGIIDQRMYEMLLRADLVIADITTANPNALYELGVRHALRPYSTIVIKELDEKFLFDLSHLATVKYKHLGEDIGATEAREKQAALEGLIRAVLAHRETDSPVYTFLRGLQQPIMSDQELDRAVRRVENASDESCAALIAAGRLAAEASRHAEARDLFRRAHDLQKGDGIDKEVDPFVVQQLALHTYKAKQPTPVEALRSALAIIQQLTPDDSIDPETLGITGAIRRRLWESDPTARAHLNASVRCYGRGFEVKGDYYNGENYALCLDLRAKDQTDPVEANYDRMTAQKVRRRVQDTLTRAFGEHTAFERPDLQWMLATMSNVARALKDVATADDYEARFRALRRPQWELDTFEAGRRYAEALAGSRD